MATVFQPIAARPAPGRTSGLAARIRANLFADVPSTIATLVILALAIAFLPGIVEWTFTKAVFRPDANACQAARGEGACWGVIAEKWRFIVLGRYPFEQQWRPELATIL